MQIKTNGYTVQQIGFNVFISKDNKALYRETSYKALDEIDLNLVLSKYLIIVADKDMSKTTTHTTTTTTHTTAKDNTNIKGPSYGEQQ